MCTRVVRPGGRVTNIGVHGKVATLHLEDLWIKDITTTGPVDAYCTPMLLRMMAAGRLVSAGDTGALEVALGGPQHNEISTLAQP